ncbi:hypothetical protein COY26_03865 [Candidatus Woesearchaeota archaeon CG_4_10_14_0_2_um_filter_33_10]|nr:MAG: hypothetical protein COY26_03865 [Candidatus Woesearchaeota archaeon CG_4_10_14_0_2_um_filter_33_10]
MPTTVLFSVFASSTWTLFTLVSFDPLDFVLKKVFEVSHNLYDPCIIKKTGVIFCAKINMVVGEYVED